jgi:hypothetical protein
VASGRKIDVALDGKVRYEVDGGDRDKVKSFKGPDRVGGHDDLRAGPGMTGLDTGPELVLGPLLRYAGTESATFWVETSARCEVEILGRSERTFTVEGHHYALVLVEDLEPASVTPYDVRLDGIVAWPPPDGRPQPVVHTRDGERFVRLMFGSCRVGGPEPESPAGEWPADLRELGVDALWTYSKLLQRGKADWPDAVLLLGDQVYADEVSPRTLEFIRSRRDTGEPPGEQVSPTSRSTRASTASRGPTPTSAGCSPPSRPR